MPEDNDALFPPVRVPKALLELVRITAARKDETLSQVLRRALRDYVRRPVPSSSGQTDIEDAIAATREPAAKPQRGPRRRAGAVSS